MINTVLGPIKPSKMGFTLCHEHIIWNSNGANTTDEYNKNDVVNKMLPYLVELKQLGCNTFVEASPFGSGRDIEVLKECSLKSGLNIITCVGAWDGLDDGNHVPDIIKDMNKTEIANLWSNEFFNGIDNTDIKPGIIKIALAGSGAITELQEKLLRAAAITCIKTNLPLQCHIVDAKNALEVVKIVEEEKMPLHKLIWLHSDIAKDYPIIKKMIKKGAWVAFDWALYMAEDYDWYINTIRNMAENKLIDKLLISQDSGAYDIAQKDGGSNMRLWSKLFNKIIPYFASHGISQDTLIKIFVTNPTLALNIE